MIKRIFALWCLGLSLTAAAHASVHQNIAQVYGLLNARLDLVVQVAVIKYHQQARLYDAGRERLVLQNAKRQAHKNGLSVPSMLVFTQIQMAVSKQLEAYHVRQWHARNKVPSASLTLAQIRDKILKIDAQIIAQLKKIAVSSMQSKLRRDFFTGSQQLNLPDDLSIMKLMMAQALWETVSQ